MNCAREAKKSILKSFVVWIHIIIRNWFQWDTWRYMMILLKSRASLKKQKNCHRNQKQSYIRVDGRFSLFSLILFLCVFFSLLNHIEFYPKERKKPIDCFVHLVYWKHSVISVFNQIFPIFLFASQTYII